MLHFTKYPTIKYQAKYTVTAQRLNLLIPLVLYMYCQQAYLTPRLSII